MGGGKGHNKFSPFNASTTSRTKKKPPKLLPATVQSPNNKREREIKGIANQEIVTREITKVSKGGFHKQHHSLNKPQFIGVTPTGGGALKLKDCIIHPHQHYHQHMGASEAAIGSVSGGGGTGAAG